MSHSSISLFLTDAHVKHFVKIFSQLQYNTFEKFYFFAGNNFFLTSFGVYKVNSYYWYLRLTSFTLIQWNSIFKDQYLWCIRSYVCSLQTYRHCLNPNNTTFIRFNRKEWLPVFEPTTEGSTSEIEKFLRCSRYPYLDCFGYRLLKRF